MEHDTFEQDVARKSALLYLPISLGAALLFLLVTGLGDSYPVVAVIGGAVWIGLLSLIISMPLVTARVKKQLREKAPVT
jgi:hypothetical protein